MPISTEMYQYGVFQIKIKVQHLLEFGVESWQDVGFKKPTLKDQHEIWISRTPRFGVEIDSEF